jgi:hypothetical protein
LGGGRSCLLLLCVGHSVGLPYRLQLVHELNGLRGGEALQRQRGGLREVPGQQLLLLLQHGGARQRRVWVEVEGAGP